MPSAAQRVLSTGTRTQDLGLPRLAASGGRRPSGLITYSPSVSQSVSHLVTKVNYSPAYQPSIPSHPHTRAHTPHPVGRRTHLYLSRTNSRLGLAPLQDVA